MKLKDILCFVLTISLICFLCAMTFGVIYEVQTERIVKMRELELKQQTLSLSEEDFKPQENGSISLGREGAKQ